MGIAIILCSRSDSKRIPNKVFRKIGRSGTVLTHLLYRLLFSELPILLAVPGNQFQEYAEFLKKNNYENQKWKNGIPDRGVFLCPGSYGDPLERMYETAKKFGITTIIRVTHDKIFVPHEEIKAALNLFQAHKADYLFTPLLTDGMGFEIISFESLKKAKERFNNVEHISYAIRAVTDKVLSYIGNKRYRSNFRFLIDYPEDLRLISNILNRSGLVTPARAIDIMKSDFGRGMDDNRLPLVTIYTCFYKTDLYYFEKCLKSIYSQSIIKDAEIIIVNDGGRNFSSMITGMIKATLPLAKLTIIHNQKNVGLASSSNIALERARGKHIIRLDSDDYFTKKTSVEEMIERIEKNHDDVIYPANYFGNYNLIQTGNLNHHIGGALFRTKSINMVKFTEGLRGYEGLDFWARAKELLKITYMEKPLFFYRQHAKSLSKNNNTIREKIKKDIETKYGLKNE